MLLIYVEKLRCIDFGDFTSQKINLDLRLNAGVIFVPEHRFENSDCLEFGLFTTFKIMIFLRICFLSPGRVIANMIVPISIIWLILYCTHSFYLIHEELKQYLKYKEDSQITRMALALPKQ